MATIRGCPRTRYILRSSRFPNTHHPLQTRRGQHVAIEPQSTLHDRLHIVRCAGCESCHGRFRIWHGSLGNLGAGFSKSPGADGGLAISGDLGVVFQGSPSFDLNVTCGAAVPTVTCTRLQSDADAERAAFEDDTDEYKYFPVVSVGLGYRW